MKSEKYDIVIVENNVNDAELIVRILEKKQATKNLIVLKDGEQALDYLLCRANYNDRNIRSVPKAMFWT